MSQVHEGPVSVQTEPGQDECGATGTFPHQVDPEGVCPICGYGETPLNLANYERNPTSVGSGAGF